MVDERQAEPQNSEKAETPTDVPTTQAFGAQPAAAADVSIPNYRLVKQIGKGASGTVWLAAEELTGVYRAVKVVQKTVATDDGGETSDQSSASDRELSGLREYSQRIQGHPHLLQILHVGESSENFYSVMELADGDHGTAPEQTDRYEPLTLSTQMKRRGVFSPTDALDTCRQILVGLDHLHGQGLIHRDVKPANLLISGGAIKLGDIGLVTRQDRDFTQVGTLGYLPPDGVVDETTDLYAVGKILYELSTGLDRSRFPELPTGRLKGLREQWALAEVNRIFSKAAHPNRRQRYRSAADFIRAVDKARKAVLHPAVGSCWRAIPRRTKAIASVALVVIVVLLAVWQIAIRPPGDPTPGDGWTTPITKTDPPDTKEVTQQSVKPTPPPVTAVSQEAGSLEWQIFTNPNVIESFHFDGSDVWVGTTGGLLHSHDQGHTWELLTVATGLQCDDVKHVFRHSGELYLCGWGGGAVQGDGKSFRFVEGVGPTAWTRRGVEFKGDLFFTTYGGIRQLSDGKPTGHTLTGYLHDGIVYNEKLCFSTRFEGLLVFDGSEWTRLTQDNSELPSNRLGAMAVIDGRLWIASSIGIVIYDGSTFTTITTRNSGIPSNQIRGIAGTATDVWIATNRGAARFDGVNWTTYNAGNSALTTSNFATIGISPSGSVWMGTFGEGIFAYDGTNWMSYRYESRIPHPRVQMLEPALDSMWVGSEHNGLSRYQDGTWTIYNQDNSPLQHNSVRGLSSNDRYLAVVTLGAIHFVDDSGWTVQTSRELGAHASFGTCVSLGDDNIAYVGSKDGLYSGSVGSLQWTRHATFEGTNVQAVLHSPLGAFCATGDGVYHAKDGADWSEFFPQQLTGDAPVREIRYHAGKVYFCVDVGGLFVWDGSQLDDIAPRSRPYTIAHEPSGRTWLGCYGGLYRQEVSGGGWLDLAPTELSTRSIFTSYEIEYWRGAMWSATSVGLWVACLPEGQAVFDELDSSEVSDNNDDRRSSNSP